MNFLQIVLVLTGVLFIFISLMVLSTCSMSDPPQCGTIIDASPCLSISVISFILAYYLGKKDKSEETGEE